VGSPEPTSFLTLQAGTAVVDRFGAIVAETLDELDAALADRDSA
jgi:hypothetical protein